MIQVLLYNTYNLAPVICQDTVKWLYTDHLWVNSWLVIFFLNELELICLNPRIAIFSVRIVSIIETLIFLFDISHLFAHSFK